jgi:uncharacterized membrane protein YfcA
MMKKKLVIIGLATGILNGLIGGGAGMLCVPLLRKQMNEEKGAHAYTVATILSASAISMIVYAIHGQIDFGMSWKYLIGGILAAPIGVFLLKKAKPSFIKKSFAVFMIYCAVRIFIDA